MEEQYYTILGFFFSNLAFLLLGFWMGTFRVGQTNLLPKIKLPEKPYVEKPDPYLESMKEPEIQRKETIKDG